MLESVIEKAEYIGHLLVGQEKTTKKKIAKPTSTANADLWWQDVYFLIKPFKDNEMWVNHRDMLLNNLLGLQKKEVTFWISWNQTKIHMYVKVPKNFAEYFQNTFYTNYPTSDLTVIEPIQIPTRKQHIRFANSSILKTKTDFTKDGSYMDPMSDILSLYWSIPKGAKLDLYFTYMFKENRPLIILRNRIKKWAEYLNDSKDNPETAQAGKEILKTEIYVDISYHTENLHGELYESIKNNIKTVFAAFTDNAKIKIWINPKRKGMAITQAVNFFHIPTKENFAKELEYTVYRKLPYPNNVPTLENSKKWDVTIVGTTDYRAEKVELGIRREDKARHVYIVWKTGTGKSTFISNMVKSDMIAGNGLALLDPHGDLVETVMEHIPPHRINDVVLFDVSDTSHPIGFNLLQYENEDEKNLIVSWVVSTFYRLFAHSRWPRLEYILRNVLLSIVEYPNATLMHILRVLVDQWFREEVISHITDPLVLKFWTGEFNTWMPKQREEAISPITNKIGQFLSSSVVRNIFGQPRTKLNLRKAMDEGKIILINLSKGKIGEDNAAMIGSLLVTKFQIDAMSRADIDYNDRRDFYLYIDEFQNFATSSFTTILSEARKYKLSLIVANQFTSQLLPEIKDAIFGNIGTIISFTLGHDDATIMSAQFKEMVSSNDLISLPKFTAYSKLMIDGVTSDPFSMKTMPLSRPEWSKELRQKIIKQSRQRYAAERGELEVLMNAWNKKTFSAQEKVADKAKLESLWLTEDEAQVLQDPFVESNSWLFEQYIIGEEQADAIIIDTKEKKHKTVWFTKPDNIDQETKKSKSIGTTDVYIHNEHTDPNGEPLMVLVGKKDDIKKTIEKAKQLKFLMNVSKLNTQEESPVAKKTSTKNTDTPTPKTTAKFTIKDIKIGESYEWYVKLLYNYGIFVTVKGVEWLLHKKYIKVPKEVERKKFFNIGDKIKVVAQEFKEIKGEKRIVWGMK
jgi:hypothetical protein